MLRANDATSSVVTAGKRKAASPLKSEEDSRTPEFPVPGNARRATALGTAPTRPLSASPPPHARPHNVRESPR